MRCNQKRIWQGWLHKAYEGVFLFSEATIEAAGGGGGCICAWSRVRNPREIPGLKKQNGSWAVVAHAFDPIRGRQISDF